MSPLFGIAQPPEGKPDDEEPTEQRVYVDPALGWRTQNLVAAGLPLCVAEAIAQDKSIDLHTAVDLCHKTSPELVALILL